jgi:hypothetical protein
LASSGREERMGESRRRKLLASSRRALLARIARLG